MNTYQFVIMDMTESDKVELIVKTIYYNKQYAFVGKYFVRRFK